jgi:uncharacterized protein YuzE
MADIDYDPEVKILSIKMSDNKIADSDMEDHCVIDYDKDGKIVKIEVLEANLEKLLKSSKSR